MRTEQKRAIPLLDLKRQCAPIRREIDEAIKGVIDAQAFIMGNEVSKLEEAIAAYCGTKYAIGVSSGTDALALALKAVGIKQGDEVITVPFTFIATAEVISNMGARPVFVDIEPRTYNIDPSKIESKITSRTKAIMPVHLYGQCADMDPINEIAKRRNLRVIEDCAQALGATYNNKKAGSLSNVGCISFFPSKNLGCFGDGGIIVTDDSKIAEQVRLLRVHGSSKRYMHSIIGDNCRLDNLQASVLNVKLKYLDGWTSKKQKNAEFLNAAFKEIKSITTPYVPSCNTHTYHQYTLRTDASLRDRIVKFLLDSGIETRVYYPIPLHMQECYKGLGYKPEDCPETKDASETVFSLPVFPELEKAELEYIVSRVKEFYSSL